MKTNVKSIVKAAVYVTIVAGFFAATAYAGPLGNGSANAPANSLGDVAGTLTLSYANVARAITALSYIAGFGFTIASIFKLKQHKDNPQQIPVTTGIALLALGVGLIFMPSIFEMGGATLFATPATAGVNGITTFTGGDSNGS